MDNIQKVKKIAVVAVHGVGDRMPFETAHRIGDLLQDLNIAEPRGGPPPLPASPQRPVYYPFREHTLRVDVRPMVARKSGQEQQALPQEQSPAHPRESRGPFNTWVKACLKEGKSVHNDEMWYEFTKGRLIGYQGDDPEDTCQIVCMEGIRAPQPQVGRDRVTVLHHRTAEWRRFRSLQTYAAGILTVPIPILNLFVAGTIAVVVALTALRNAKAEPVFSA